MTTDDLMLLMRAKYAPPAYVFLTEVASGTGDSQGGYCDAVAMGLWSSKGLYLIGFELKVSRPDWLRELRDLKKSARFIPNFDQWYLVVGDDLILDANELPDKWGLIAPTHQHRHNSRWGLRVVKRAPQLKPEPMTRQFLAALLRRANGPTGYPEVEQ